MRSEVNCPNRLDPFTIHLPDQEMIQSVSLNVAALLILWASLMRFFSLFKPGPKKCPARIMRFFFFFLGGGCCSCVLMVNLKAATT